MVKSISHELVRKHLVLLGTVLIFGIVAYSNTFNAPFLFDDIFNIVNNPAVREPSVFVDLDKAAELSGTPYKDNLYDRMFGTFTFALNYEACGQDVRCYHATNISIHVLTAFLLYSMVILLFRSPWLERSSLQKNAVWIAFYCALIFIVHPVQTQAVTYIVQRYTSLAVLFYLLSVNLYLLVRTSRKTTLRAVLYLAMLAAAVLAMKTKEISYTIPITIAVVEILFFSGPRKIRFLLPAPLFLLAATLGSFYLHQEGSFSGMLHDIQALTTVQPIPKLTYLITEARVMVTYLRLLALPIGQNLDYDYPIFTTVFDPALFSSVLVLAVLMFLAIFMILRSRRGEPSLRVVGFGILWFFITLSIESALVTLHVINEHRLYLPSAGIIMAAVTGLMIYADARGWDIRKRPLVLVSMCVLPVMFTAATLQRNGVWGSTIGMWEDTAEKSPSNARVQTNLGSAYAVMGESGAAYRHLKAAVALDPENAEANNNLGVFLGNHGKLSEEIGFYKKAISIRPDFADAHYNLALAYQTKGEFKKAIQHYNMAIQYDPLNADAYGNLGIIYYQRGETDKAINFLQNAARLDPDIVEVYYELGLAYLSKADPDNARLAFEKALQIDPSFQPARRFLDTDSKGPGGQFH